MFEEYWSFALESKPLIATLVGDHRFDDKLDDLSQEGFDKWTRKAEDLLARLQRIRRESLGPRDILNYDLFARELQQRVEAARFRPNLMPIDQLNGPHIDIPQLTALQRFATVTDYENWVKRLQAFPAQIDQTIYSLEEGLKTGIVLARVTAEKVLSQIKLQIVSAPESSELYKPAEKFPERFSQAEGDRLSGRMKDAITQHVVPAYQKLFDFMQNSYLPGCRAEIGLWALPEGEARYKFYVRSYTSTLLSPGQIHELGKKELSRIHNEMKLVMDKVGFKGDLQAFFKHLREDSRFHNTSAESILSGYREILARIETRIDQLFGKVPRAQCEIKPVEEYIAAEAPLAYYFPAPDDRSRPAYFYANTYKPESRPTYDMEVTAYHEAVPGHHFQLSLQQELKDLPNFRRHGGYIWPGYIAFTEGWGLYCEVLPKELGLYEDPYSDFGRLASDVFRAARLVIDTGIHYLKWTREQAIDFFEKNTALSTHDIVAEVERYVVLPGQALSYKIGQLKILELRSKAEKALGKRFDLKAFHDELLADGALPLDLLENKMQNWISLVS